MNNMKKSIKRVFWLTVCLFLLLIVSLLKIIYFDRDAIITNSYNPRLNYEEGRIKRGLIQSVDGSILAESEKTENGYTRHYPYGNIVSHVTGYTGMGKTGVEAAENFQLIQLHNEIWQRLKNIFNKTELQGNTVVTTIDLEIQKKAADLLGSQKGAIVALEPSTGRVLAMASSPSYDPNLVEKNWDALRQEETSPLINRTTQGLYPPGSTLKTLTAVMIMRNKPDWKEFVYECRGEAEFDGKIIHCFDGKAHGEVTLESAFAVSCNCYFAQMAKEIGAQSFILTAEQFYLNRPVPFILSKSDSSFGLTVKSTETELVETSIGQGKTTVTPLFMAMLASSVANDGIMMQPYLIDHIEYYNGKRGTISVPKKVDIVITPQEAEILTQMMIQVVNEGTGTPAQISGIQAAGKTGTAENETGEDHSWFIGFAPADHPEIAVAVVLENAGGKRSAASLAGKLMKTALQS